MSCGNLEVLDLSGCSGLDLVRYFAVSIVLLSRSLLFYGVAVQLHQNATVVALTSLTRLKDLTLGPFEKDLDDDARAAALLLVNNCCCAWIAKVVGVVTRNAGLLYEVVAPSDFPVIARSPITERPEHRSVLSWRRHEPCTRAN